MDIFIAVSINTAYAEKVRDVSVSTIAAGTDMHEVFDKLIANINNAYDYMAIDSPVTLAHFEPVYDGKTPMMMYDSEGLATQYYCYVQGDNEVGLV